ncbi:uncharacterized protein LOC127705534 [Mytilus californianus]|uniref:uncharacterized protein LOC127705534 n=1 Tax=Mytilus californianus TaxID=6549 RepID=UPI002245845A|nr:uncharacterized protein LOC127705534 [Mytilus californianus]
MAWGIRKTRLYWSCATCERNFHPQCLGYAENSVKPFDFHCPECELSPVKALKRKRYSVNIDKETEVNEEISNYKEMEDDGEITDNEEISHYKEMQDDEDLTDNEKVQGYHKTDSESEVEYDDDFNLEFADFEQLRIKNHLYEIMNCEDSKCVEVEHERHHEFVSAPQKVYNRERRTVAFGCEVVNQKV